MAKQVPLIGGKVVISLTPDGGAAGVLVNESGIPQVSVPFNVTTAFVPTTDDEEPKSTITFQATVPDGYEAIEFLLSDGTTVTMFSGETDVTVNAASVLNGAPTSIFIRSRVRGGAAGPYREVDLSGLYEEVTPPDPITGDLVVTGVPTFTFSDDVRVNSTFFFNLPVYTGTSVTVLRRFIETDEAIPVRYDFPSDNTIPAQVFNVRIRPGVTFRQPVNGVNTDTTVLGAYTSTAVLAPPQARTILPADIDIRPSIWTTGTTVFRADIRIPVLTGDFQWSTSSLAGPTENQWETLSLVSGTTYIMQMTDSAKRTGVPPTAGVDFAVFGVTTSENSRRSRLRIRWRPNSITPWSLPSDFFVVPAAINTPAGINTQQWNWISLRTSNEIGEDKVNHPSLCSLPVTGFDARLGGGGLQGGHTMYVGADGDFLYLGDMNGFRRARRNEFLWHYPEARNLWCVSGNGIGTDPDLPSRKFIYASGAYYSNAQYEGGIFRTDDDCESFTLVRQVTAAHCDTRRATNLMAFFPTTAGLSGTALSRANARRWRMLQWSGENTRGTCRFWTWTGDGTGITEAANSRVMPSPFVNNADNSPTFGFVIQDPGVQGRVYIVWTNGIYRINDVDAWVTNGDTVGNTWTKIGGTAITNNVMSLWIDPTDNTIALVTRNAGDPGVFYSSNFQNTTPTWTKVLTEPACGAIGVGPVYNEEFRDIIVAGDRSTGVRVPIRQEWRFKNGSTRLAPGTSTTTGAWATGVWKRCAYDLEGFNDPDNVHVREMMGNLQGNYYLPDPTNRLIWQGPGYMSPVKSTDGGRTWTRNDNGFCGINPTGMIIFGKPSELGSNPTDRCDVAITDQFASVTTNKWQTRDIKKPDNFDISVVKNPTVRIGGTDTNPINLTGVNAGGSVGARAIVRIPNVSGVATSARNRVLYSVGKGDAQCLALQNASDANMSLLWYTGTGASRVRRSDATGGGKHNMVSADNHLTNPNIAYIGPYVYNIDGSGAGSFSYVFRDSSNTTQNDLMNFIDRSEQNADRLYAMRGPNLSSNLWYTTTGHSGTWNLWHANGVTISLWGYKGAFVCPHNHTVVMFPVGSSPAELRNQVKVVRGDPGSQSVTTLAVPAVTTLRQTSIRGMVWCGKYPQRAYITLVNPGGPRIYRLNFSSDYSTWDYTDVTFNAPLFGNIWSNPNTGELWVATQGQGLWVLPAPEGAADDATWWLAANRPTPRG